MSRPGWFDRGEPPPPDVARLVERYRADLLAGRTSKRRLVSEHGLSDYQAMAVSLLVRRDAAAQAAPPPERAPPRDLPEIERWDAPPPPPESIPPRDPGAEAEDGIEELIEARRAVFHRAKANHERNRERVYTLPDRKPIGLMIVGDPHVDDDGADWDALLRVVKLIAATPGVFGVQMGDASNNWVGKLERLWAHQSTTDEDAIRLVRWLAAACPWIGWILGNHDRWNHGSQLAQWLTAGTRIKWIEPSEMRLRLAFPASGSAPAVETRSIFRHDFRGRSMWNNTHGPMRAGKLDPWAELYAGGHIHEWGVHQWEGRDGVPRRAVRVRGFKRLDHYAADLGLYEHLYGEAVLAIVDPNAHPMQRIQLWWDLEAGCDYLRWMRRER